MLFWRLCYKLLVIPALRLAVWLGPLLGPKIRSGLEGRKQIFDDLARILPPKSDSTPRIWIHASSMGEFEQARPVVEALRAQYPQSLIVLTLFSPSAFDHISNFEAADAVCYLPIDTRGNGRRFLDLVRPDVAITVRHDFWPNILYMLNERQIPSILINCTIPHPPSLALKLFPSVNRFLHGAFDVILTVSPEAADYAQRHGWGRGTVKQVGDTRYDQVVRRAAQSETVVKPLRPLKGERLGLVLGSSWPEGETVYFEALEKLKKRGVECFVVAVPHEPHEDHLLQLESRCQTGGLSSVRLSRIEEGNPGEVDVLIVDRIGMLANLYALGEVAYVGGGFATGLHNVLEPAALGKTVLFGPKYQKSYEAGQLVRRGVGFSCADAESVEARLFSLYSDAHEREVLGKRARQLVQENVGATDRIVETVKQQLQSR